LFKKRVLDAAAQSPAPVRSLVVAAEPATSVDVAAADILAELNKTLHEAGIELSFAELKDPVEDKLKRFGLLAQIGKNFFLPTIGSASSYVENDAVDRVDWEDQSWRASQRDVWQRGGTHYRTRRLASRTSRRGGSLDRRFQ
jgi:hypothetical protein